MNDSVDCNTYPLEQIVEFMTREELEKTFITLAMSKNISSEEIGRILCELREQTTIKAKKALRNL